MTWNEYHYLLVGYEIRRRSDGCITGKVGLWYKYKNYPVQIELLLSNQHEFYEKVSKPDYKDGKYIGVMEGEGNPSRIYRLCPERKPPPLKRIYDKKIE